MSVYEIRNVKVIQVSCCDVGDYNKQLLLFDYSINSAAYYF